MGTNKLKKMMKKMEDALAAASFAEEGERRAARSILSEGRRVLLALKEGRIDAKTLKYAAEHCQEDRCPSRYSLRLVRPGAASSASR